MRARPRAQRTHAQLRDSPGARLRSTASIAGWTSNVGSGVSGSTSSSPPAAPPVPIPSPRPIPGPPDGVGCPDEKSENIDGVCARCVGFHAGGWGAGVVGESSERREDDTEVLRPCRGLLVDGRWPAVNEDGLSSGVMSMLPPPTTCRLSRLARTWLRVRACSGVKTAPGAGVRDSVPTSCA